MDIFDFSNITLDYDETSVRHTYTCKIPNLKAHICNCLELESIKQCDPIISIHAPLKMGSSLGWMIAVPRSLKIP